MRAIAFVGFTALSCGSPVFAPSGGAASCDSPAMELAISDYGGRKLSGPTRLEVVWYGDWGNAEERNLLIAFLGGISSSSWWTTNASYGVGVQVVVDKQAFLTPSPSH